MIDKLVYRAIVNYIYDIEVVNNHPYYAINKDIKIHNISEGKFNYSIGYSVEFISQLDQFWKKWNTKRINIDIDGENFIPYIRDAKIDSIIKKTDY